MKTQNEKDLISLSRMLANFLSESVEHFEAMPMDTENMDSDIDSHFITELTNKLLNAQAGLLDFVVRSSFEDSLSPDDMHNSKKGRKTIH